MARRDISSSTFVVDRRPCLERSRYIDTARLSLKLIDYLAIRVPIYDRMLIPEAPVNHMLVGHRI